MTHNLTFGDLLKYARRAAGLTQEALAARAGVSARAISDFERNINHTPRPGTVQLLIAALSLSDQEREQFELAAQRLDPQADAARVLTSAALPPLVGRSTERTLLERHIAGDGPPFIVLTGEPGVGKTRLLQEAASVASARGLDVLHGTVPALGERGSRDPIVDALRRAIQQRSPVDLRRDLRGCAWLVRALPELELGPIQPLPVHSLDADQEFALTLRAMLRFLNNVAGSAGTLLTLDNLHAADPAALAVLARLVHAAKDAPVRIIGAYRDGESSPGDGLSALLASLAHEQAVQHFSLAPLSLDEAGALLDRVARGGEAAPAWLDRDRILQQTGGVPFYVVAWADQLNVEGSDAADGPPWPIRHSVRHRIGAGPPAVRPVLEALAAAGGRATYPLLVSLAAEPEGEVVAALESATRNRLVEEDGHAYAFAYEVVHSVIQGDLSHARRRLLRRRLTAVVPHDAPSAGVARKLPTAEERAYHLGVLRQHRDARSAGTSARPA